MVFPVPALPMTLIGPVNSHAILTQRLTYKTSNCFLVFAADEEVAISLSVAASVLGMRWARFVVLGRMLVHFLLIRPS